MNIKDKILKEFDDHALSLNIPNMKAFWDDEITASLKDFSDLSLIKKMLWPKNPNKN
jgi:hypothetical protein